MSTKSRPAPATPGILPQTTALIAIASFALGAGVTWYAMHESSGENQQPPSFIAHGPQGPVGSLASNNAAPNSPSNSAPMQGMAESASPVPPDVSQLPPAQAALTLGNWNYDRKNWSDAVSQYQKAISMGLDNANIRTDLGNAFRFLGDPRKALEQYQIAQDKDPQHENSLYNMATLYTQVLHDQVNAVATLQDYLRRFPNGQRVPAAQQLLREINSSSAMQPAKTTEP